MVLPNDGHSTLFAVAGGLQTRGFCGQSRPGKKKETLEANLGNGVKFRLTLTLLFHLPGTEPEAKPEPSNFKFTKFMGEHGPGSRSPMANMPNVNCQFRQSILISKLLGETLL
jgi:hypothetical protein